MTRTDDTFVALAERVSFARDRKAALFISVDFAKFEAMRAQVNRD